MVSKAVEKKIEAGAKQGKVDLTGFALVSVPQPIFDLFDLRVLWLADNQLRTLSPDVRLLTSLTQLRLHNNQLSSLPDELFTLGSLQVLWLQNNKLSSIPREIGRLTSLTALSLNNNPYTHLPTEIMGLRCSFFE